MMNSPDLRTRLLNSWVVFELVFVSVVFDLVVFWIFLEDASQSIIIYL